MFSYYHPVHPGTPKQILSLVLSVYNFTASLLSPNTLMNTSFLDISNRTKFNQVSNEFTASIFMAENTRISSLRFGDAPVKLSSDIIVRLYTENMGDNGF
jgi:hypothetical protein